MIFDSKEDVDLNDLKMIQPATLILFTFVALYCKEHNLPFKITSLISDRDNINSSSDTHEEGRAFDLSIKGWDSLHKSRLVYLLNTNYSDIAAVSKSDNIPRAAILHDSGYGPHIHIQVKRDAPWHKFVKY